MPIWDILKLTYAPLLSLFILILGNGLFNTLITVRLHAEEYSALTIGLMTSVYYAGLFFASFNSEHFIIRVGHIRAFSAFASALAITCLLHGLYVNLFFWLALRVIAGFCIAGLFIVIESWLLVQGTVKSRGQVLAFYMLTLYAGQALGQFLINTADPKTLVLFTVTAMLCSLSVIPLAITRVGSPQFTEPASLNFKTLYGKSASGIIGCFCSGLMLAAVYGLLPLFISEQTNNNADIALFMALTILGGMALQYPVGRISDHIDRRLVLIFISCAAVIMSVFMNFAFHWYYFSLAAMFLFGGFVFTIYPVSISHACDTLDSSQIVAGTQGLLLAYSAGAMIGPFIAAIFMSYFGSHGLFLYFAVIGIGLSVFFMKRRLTITVAAPTEAFIPLIQTSPIAAELDPRSEDSLE